MSEQSAESLMKSLAGKINLELTGGSGLTPPDTEHFTVFCAPGVPFQEEDLLFLQKGINGKDAEETVKLIDQAADFALMVDLVPSVDGVYDDKQQVNTFEQKGTTLSSVYKNVLQFSEVADGELSAAIKAKLEKFRNLLFSSKEITDMITDEVLGVQPMDGPLLQAYNEYMAKFIAADLQYNNKRLAALNAETRLAVQDWALNADNYRLLVKAAENDWNTKGYRYDVDRVHAFIANVTQNDLSLWKVDLQDRLRRSMMTSSTRDQDFYYTTAIPGYFPTATAGWTTIEFAEKDVETYSRNETTKWGGRAGFSWGIFGLSAGASGMTRKGKYEFKTKSFKMSFSITQTPISRPWYDPNFLTNTAWRFPEGRGMQALSDGKKPPKGQLPAYATTAVWARDIRIETSELEQLRTWYDSEINVSGGLSIGPFSLGGRYSRNVGERTFKSNFDAKGLKVEGLQLIALKCRALSKSPNPSDMIKKWSLSD